MFILYTNIVSTVICSIKTRKSDQIKSAKNIFSTYLRKQRNGNGIISHHTMGHFAVAAVAAVVADAANVTAAAATVIAAATTVVAAVATVVAAASTLVAAAAATVVAAVATVVVAAAASAAIAVVAATAVVAVGGGAVVAAVAIIHSAVSVAAAAVLVVVTSYFILKCFLVFMDMFINEILPVSYISNGCYDGSYQFFSSCPIPLLPVIDYQMISCNRLKHLKNVSAIQRIDY